MLTLVFVFESSAALAYAYGMAVTATITITTIVFFYITWRTQRAPLWFVLGAGALLVTLDLLLVAANLTKLVHGAWLPLVIALVAFTVMTTWQRGRALVTSRREAMEGPLREFVGSLSAPDPGTTVVDGTAVFLNRGTETAPLALRANVEHNHVRHAHVVIATVQFDTVPRVPDSERVRIDSLDDPGDGITHVTIRFGYVETPDVPRALALLTDEQTEGRLDLDDATYFLSRIELRRDGDAHDMAPWRKRLFIATSHLTADAAEHFGLPGDRTVILGAHVSV